MKLRTAAWQLLSGDDNLATIAPTIGYQCGFGLSKAIKRVIGVTPSLVRDRFPSGYASKGGRSDDGGCHAAAEQEDLARLKSLLEQR